MQIKTSDRIFISGHTGFGKTFLARNIFKNCKRGIVYDPSHENSDLGHVLHDTNQIQNAMKKYPKIVFQPISPTDKNTFEQFCKLTFAKSNNFMYYLDEIHLYTSPFETANSYARILTTGRKYGVGCISVTQRTAACSKIPISQADHVIAFGCFIPHDIKIFVGFFGKEIAEQLQNLPKYNYIYYSNSLNKIELRDQNSNVLKVLK